METIKVNMNPNPLDVQTIHASQNDGEARQWGFELHNNGEKIDSSSISDQLVFKAYEGGTEEILPTNGSTPTTSPFKGDIKYPQGLLSDQEFLYRESPTESDGLAFIENIKGNTLNWNQLVPLNAIRQSGEVVPSRGLSYTNNGDGSITLSGTASESGIASFYFIADNVLPCIQNHKYLTDANNRIFGSGTVTESGHCFVATSNGYMRLWARIPVVANTVYNLTYYPQIYDLTQMFGSSKADEIYAMETAQSGSGVAYFRSLYPVPYYSYNQGTLLSFNGNGIKTVGFNQWDEEWETGGISGLNGNTYNDSTRIRSKNYISVLPNTSYYVKAPRAFNYAWYGENKQYISGDNSASPNYVRKSPNGARYLKISTIATTYNHDICINISSSRNGTYEPYTSSTLSLPISTYFPTGMKSAGNVYDELTESKAITRIGAVDLGSLNWIYQSSSGNMYVDNVVSNRKNNLGFNAICSKYQQVNENTIEAVGHLTQDKSFAFQSTLNGRIIVRDTSYTDATVFKQAMADQNVKLYYELATPTETSFTTASLVTENAEIPLSNEDGTLIGKCTEQLSENPGFFDAKIKLSDADGECYSNKIQLHVERSPQ